MTGCNRLLFILGCEPDTLVILFTQNKKARADTQLTVFETYLRAEKQRAPEVTAFILYLYFLSHQFN